MMTNGEKGDAAAIETVSETASLVRELRALGLSFEQIGSNLGVNWRTVYRWSRDENHPWSTVAINRILTGLVAEHAVKEG